MLQTIRTATTRSFRIGLRGVTRQKSCVPRIAKLLAIDLFHASAPRKRIARIKVGAMLLIVDTSARRRSRRWRRCSAGQHRCSTSTKINTVRFTRLSIDDACLANRCRLIRSSRDRLLNRILIVEKKLVEWLLLLLLLMLLMLLLLLLK